MAPIIHWFRRDLRLDDNTALAAAAHDSGGTVLPVFILDDRLLTGPSSGAPRIAFLLESLRALDADLRARGSRLIVRRGDPLRELLALARECGAQGVYWNRDYTPYAIARDRRAKEELRAAGLAARSFKDAVVFELLEVATQEGKPYTVYTPYSRRWRQALVECGLHRVTTPALAPVTPWPAGAPLPDLAALGMDLGATRIPPAGEAAAQARLSAFVAARHEEGLAGYGARRDFMAVDGTSRLSPYLRLGALSVRAALGAALDVEAAADPAARESAGRWVGELIWRDFYVQILANFPHVARGAFRPAYDALAWENDAELFRAWQEGRTGYPVVDAAMRQLRQEGWMHNRARMIVASFLAKDLLVDWRWGEGHFMRWLVDGDPAANNGGWQWAAGTGTDAQPYFRIFNPASQGQKFDPDGAYVRRYLPELANVPNKFIHTPHLMAPAEQLRADVQVGRDYPRPVVEHKVRRQQALALYAAVRGES